MGTNKESSAARAKRFAELYVYEYPGNISKAYAALEKEYPGINDTPTTDKTKYRAYHYFHKATTQKYIEKERAEAQKAYDIRKDEIVANLQRIAFDDDSNNRDRLAALKQLTDLGGFTTQNVNLQAKADVEVVIE